MATKPQLVLTIREDGAAAVARSLDSVASRAAAVEAKLQSASGKAESVGAAAERGGARGARGLEQIDAGAVAASRSIGGLSAGLVALGTVAVGAKLAAELSAVSRAAYETNTQLAGVRRSLAAVAGSDYGGAQEFANAAKIASDLGQRLTGLAESYRDVQASAMGTVLAGEPTRRLFVSVTEAATALGLGAERTQLSLLALGQMMSKGTVQAEELRGQLGENLPGAFNIAAEAMGVSTAKLGEMLERGEVLAEDLLPRLATALHNRFGAAAREAATDAAAEFNRAENAVTQLGDAMGQAFRADLATAARNITGALSDPAVIAGVRDLGSAVGTVAVKLSEVAASGASAVAYLYRLYNPPAAPTPEQANANIAPVAQVAVAGGPPKPAPSIAPPQRSLRAQREGGTYVPSKDDTADAERLIKSAQTAQQKYNETVKEAMRLKALGLVTGEQYAQIVEHERAALDKATTAHHGARSAATRAAAEQRKFSDELTRTVAAVDPVAGAVARYSEQVGTLDAALSKGLITQQRHDALVRDAALDYRDKVDVVGAYIRKIEQENQLLGLNGTEREQARAVLEAETAARRAGLEVTDAQREAIRGLVAEQEQLRSQVEPMAKLYEHAAEQIYQSWSSLWEDLFSGNVKSLKDFGKQATDYIRKLLGQLAAQALARPVLVPVITALGGTLGMSQGAIGGTLTQLGLGGGTTATATDGGGFGIGNLSSLSNLFGGNGIGSALGGVLGAGQIGAYGAGATAGGSGLSFLGASSFGYGSAAGGSALGNAAAGFSNLAYGAAGLGGGLLGSLIAPASPYGSLAGGLGGVAGLVGASGLASGTALGAALGSAVPVLGTLIGGALGGVIARAFGDSQPDSSWFRVTSGSRSGRDARYSPLAEAQTAFGSVAVSGWEDLPGDMQKEFSAGIVQAFSQTDAALAAQLGAQYVAIARQAIDGQALASTRQLASKDPSAQVLAIFRARYGAIFGAIDSDLAAAFGRQSVTADSIGQVVADLGELFSATHPAAEALGQYATAAKALDAQWSRLTDNARKYGYQLDAVTTAWAKATSDLQQTAVDALHGNFTAAREQALLGGIDVQGRYDYFKSQADGLSAQLERAAGADNINAIAERILSLQSQAYGLLGDQAGDYSAQYVDYLDRIEQLAAARIRATDVQTADMGKQIQAGVEAVLQRALDALAAAADAQTRAAERITRALPGYG